MIMLDLFIFNTSFSTKLNWMGETYFKKLKSEYFNNCFLKWERRKKVSIRGDSFPISLFCMESFYFPLILSLRQLHREINEDLSAEVSIGSNGFIKLTEAASCFHGVPCSSVLSYVYVILMHIKKGKNLCHNGTNLKSVFIICSLSSDTSAWTEHLADCSVPFGFWIEEK